MLAVRLPKNIEERLERLAKLADRSKSYFVKKALEKFLEEEEEKQIALQAYEDYLKSGKKVHRFEDILKENDL